MFYRPGPDRIAPGTNPGGLVCHTYALADGGLILVSKMGPGLDMAERQAVADAMHVVEDPRAMAHGVVLVVYDGDTGKRWTTADTWPAIVARSYGPEGHE